MADLPKNFPEYLIMYKTLNNKIHELKEKENDMEDKKIIEENQLKIKTYQNEINRIKALFPEKFFDEKF